MAWPPREGGSCSRAVGMTRPALFPHSAPPQLKVMAPARLRLALFTPPLRSPSLCTVMTPVAVRLLPGRDAVTVPSTCTL